MPENSETPKFKPGDHVTWTSQAGGKSKTKQGRIYLTVPPGTALAELKECFVNQTFNVRADFASRRKHESYVVQVPGELRLYWPLVKYLKPVEPSPLEALKQETEPWNVDPFDFEPEDTARAAWIEECADQH